MLQCRIEKGNIETDVVPDDHSSVNKLQQRWHHCFDARCPHHHGLGYPGEDCDLWWDRGSWVDQCLVGTEALTAAKFDRTNFGDRTVGCRSTGCFQVYDDESDLVQGSTEVFEALLVYERLFEHSKTLPEHMFVVKDCSDVGAVS